MIYFAYLLLYLLDLFLFCFLYFVFFLFFNINLFILIDFVNNAAVTGVHISFHISVFVFFENRSEIARSFSISKGFNLDSASSSSYGSMWLSAPRSQLPNPCSCPGWKACCPHICSTQGSMAQYLKGTHLAKNKKGVDEIFVLLHKRTFRMT